MTQAQQDAILALINNLEQEAYNLGLRKAENTNGTTEKLAQIDRMARQIEECHGTIRRRNQEIKDLEADVRRLSQPCCKGDC